MIKDLPPFDSDNYFDGGARHRSAFDEALDRYVGAYVRNEDVMDVVKFEYKDWDKLIHGQYNRGEVLKWFKYYILYVCIDGLDLYLSDGILLRW